MSAPRKERLGRGLGALLGDYLDEEAQAGSGEEVRRVALDRIGPNPHQPRREFPEEELNELAHSIRENGLLQPLVLRPSPRGRGRFELVAGERRLRAVTRLGWEDVPALVRTVDDETLLVLALVENLQREALGPLEEAEGYRSLADTFGLTQEEIATAVGKDRSTVANMLRLLKLPPSVRKHLEGGALTMGHARALLAVDDPVRAGELARKAVARAWSVREVERRVRALREPAEADERSRPHGGAGSSNPTMRALEEELRRRLATRVKVRHGGRERGVVEISFHGAEDFERIFELITGREAAEVVR